MFNALLDYRFGWRWLLPYVPGQTLYLAGFDAVEQAFWQESFSSAEWVREADQAVGLIVDADATAARGRTEGLLAGLPCTAVQWVAAAGTGKETSRWRRHLTTEFDVIHEYGLLPASTPRLVIPLSKPSHAVAALGLHRPGRWSARLVARLAAAMAQFGVSFPLRRRVLLIASRSPSPWPIGASQAGAPVYLSGTGWDFALYLGTPDGNRKTVALPLGGWAAEALIKMGESPQARQAIKNEAAALSYLAKAAPHPGCSLARQVPQMRGLVENEHGAALYQEYRPRLKVDEDVLEAAVIDFLAQLSTIERRTRPLHEVLAGMTAAGDAEGGGGKDGAASRSLWSWLHRRAEEGVTVYEHRSHGDFAPWNCAWTKQGLFVFDWEESRPRALAFGDAFYFALAPAVHVAGKFDPAQAQAKALRLAEQVAKRGGIKAPVIPVHFALWLLAREMSHPAYTRLTEYLATERAA